MSRSWIEKNVGRVPRGTLLVLSRLCLDSRCPPTPLCGFLPLPEHQASDLAISLPLGPGWIQLVEALHRRKGGAEKGFLGLPSSQLWWCFCSGYSSPLSSSSHCIASNVPFLAPSDLRIEMMSAVGVLWVCPHPNSAVHLWKLSLPLGPLNGLRSLVFCPHFDCYK